MNPDCFTDDLLDLEGLDLPDAEIISLEERLEDLGAQLDAESVVIVSQQCENPQSCESNSQSPGKRGEPWPHVTKNPRPGPAPGEPGWDPPMFKFARARKTVQGRITMAKFMDCMTRKMSLKDAALEIGVSYTYVKAYLWPKLKEMAMADYTDPAEKERIAHLVVTSMQNLLTKALDKVSEHAAYGAVAIGAAKELRECLGLEFSGAAAGDDQTLDLESLGAQIRDAMPALMDHHDHIAKIKQRQLEAQAIESAARSLR